MGKLESPPKNKYSDQNDHTVKLTQKGSQISMCQNKQPWNKLFPANKILSAPPIRLRIPKRQTNHIF